MADLTSRRKEPWLLHSLTVNTLNFCAYSTCKAKPLKAAKEDLSDQETKEQDRILIAVPGLQEGFVNIMQLPSENRLHMIPPAKEAKGGMVMALRIFYVNHLLHLITGHESGVTTLQVLKDSKWKTVFTSATHAQPILSLDLAPDQSTYFTSGADSIIGMHAIEITSTKSSSSSARTIQTKHAGQQSLTVRSDGKIFATAGWDSRIRVYSAKTMRELAVLKWHKVGCYSVAFADISESRVSQVGINAASSVRSVRQKREDKAMETHWLAAGSKDGRVSLWDIY